MKHKVFTAEELADHIIELNPMTITKFYGGKLPRENRIIGTNRKETNVICVQEKSGGFRNICFSRTKYYDEGELKTERELPSKEKIILDIKSNVGFHGSEVYLTNDDNRIQIGTINSNYKRNKYGKLFRL